MIVAYACDYIYIYMCVCVCVCVHACELRDENLLRGEECKTQVNLNFSNKKGQTR